jgi:hypothetical protein
LEEKEHETDPQAENALVAVLHLVSTDFFLGLVIACGALTWCMARRQLRPLPWKDLGTSNPLLVAPLLGAEP